MKNMKVGNFMSTPVINLDPEATVKNAGKLIGENEVGTLFVKKGGNYLGIITKTDLIEKVISTDLDIETTKINTIMTNPILTLDREASFKKAVKLMNENKVRHLGVTENSKIVGVLSIKDISEQFAMHYVGMFR